MAFMVWSNITTKAGKEPITPGQILNWMIGLWVQTPDTAEQVSQSAESQINQAMAMTLKFGGKIQKAS